MGKKGPGVLYLGVAAGTSTSKRPAQPPPSTSTPNGIQTRRVHPNLALLLLPGNRSRVLLTLSAPVQSEGTSRGLMFPIRFAESTAIPLMSDFTEMCGRRRGWVQRAEFLLTLCSHFLDLSPHSTESVTQLLRSCLVPLLSS